MEPGLVTKFSNASKGESKAGLSKYGLGCGESGQLCLSQFSPTEALH